MRIRPYLVPPLVFMLIGPLIAFFIFYGSVLPHKGDDKLFFILMFLSCFTGAIPALITGLLYVVLWPCVARLPVLQVREQGCVTGLASVSPLVCLLAFKPHQSLREYAIVLVPAVLCGILAAKARHGGEPG
ncbi:hypothetical protein [Pseudoduganella lutea]|uniref:Uncharacterized protein n=1 Tax=Pseudoduganella lutea TaxID=321985 RepID=A0A4P6KUJ7_9BURK|nr:hypothetical protein [Pseudoduganella lutea]QBE62092.1 hypothetical protein EWM63_03095 [Pseudoduganella lutea]